MHRLSGKSLILESLRGNSDRFMAPLPHLVRRAGNHIDSEAAQKVRRY